LEALDTMKLEILDLIGVYRGTPGLLYSLRCMLPACAECGQMAREACSTGLTYLYFVCLLKQFVEDVNVDVARVYAEDGVRHSCRLTRG
jgi:hypothetical protein